MYILKILMLLVMTLYWVGGNAFAYCTDFVINVANLLGLSYYEVNTLIFIVIWPLLTILLLGVFSIQKFRYHRLRRLCAQQKH